MMFSVSFSVNFKSLDWHKRTQRARFCDMFAVNSEHWSTSKHNQSADRNIDKEDKKKENDFEQKAPVPVRSSGCQGDSFLDSSLIPGGPGFSTMDSGCDTMYCSD